jgi:hypothetical protein
MAKDQVDVSFLIGQLTGSVNALTEQVANMSITINSLDERLRSNEKSTTILTVKMAMVGVSSGAIGSFATSVFQAFITSKL